MKCQNDKAMKNRTVSADMFTRINNDTNGNPRYVIHFLDLGADYAADYAATVKWANKMGGRKYHNKSYGGGITFQSYSLPACQLFANV